MYVLIAPIKVRQRYSLAVRLSSAEAMRRARHGKTRVFQKEIGDRLSLLQMLVVMRSQEMPPPSSVSLPLSRSPPCSLYPRSPFVLLSCTHHTFLPLILAVSGVLAPQAGMLPRERVGSFLASLCVFCSV